MALIRSPEKPLHCRRIVLGHPPAFVVHDPESELSDGMALLGMNP